MSPVKIETNGIRVQIAEDLSDIHQAIPTTDPPVIKTDVFVKPVGLPDYRWVHVHGFPHEFGGIVSSILFSEDDKETTIPIVQEGNIDLPQGTNAIMVDGVLYKGVPAVSAEV